MTGRTGGIGCLCRIFVGKERDVEKKEIREAMVRMEAARKRILHPYFQKLGLTPGQPRILNKLYEEDHVSQRELADRCTMDVATLSRSLDKLEEAGYVSRQKHPDCRRAFLIVLTEEGRKKAKEVHKTFSRIDSRIWEGIEAEEMKAFLACAEKIIRNLAEE
ncbi:MAG TPA: MarR family transcriptional regulator [Candidatus Eisenbergiella merdipullorum]|uniref:MarR family transcriptional regulator n=1 Tax=Candidatus Eisenbergiella merdipullorum TaxID=2838553 RepID=A0A9D2I854_9FIRM|nr:MarR family transcriptional regulator [Candidatus Eisenbergiella merdipullorum]